MLLSLLLAIGLGGAVDCAHDREALLALEPEAFDQDMEGGWRPLADRGCLKEAADLLAAYAALPKAVGNTMIIWHEAQMRAELGHKAQAIALMERSRKPANPADPGYWNVYVDGMLAYMRQDRSGLEQARARLVAIPTPAGMGAEVKNGRYQFTTEGGQQVDVAWPPNLDVLDGLLRCFDKPYAEAYGSKACRG